MQKEIISTSKARTKLYSLVDQVGSYGRTYTLTKGGKPMAVLVSPDEYDSWMETSNVLNDRDVMEQLAESEDDVKNNRTYSKNELKKMLLKK